MYSNKGKDILFSTDYNEDNPSHRKATVSSEVSPALLRLSSKKHSVGSHTHSYDEPVQSQVIIEDEDTAAQVRTSYNTIQYLHLIENTFFSLYIFENCD